MPAAPMEESRLNTRPDRIGAVHFSIALPFYNEEACVAEAIGDIYAALINAGVSFEIIAVQNGSGDRTPQILDSLKSKYERLRVVEVPVNKGFGYGVIQGLNAAQGDIIGFMPGDRQIDAAAVPRILAEVEATQSDIGKVKRVRRRDGWQRQVASRCFNSLMRLVFNLRMDDINGEPTLLRRQVYAAMGICSTNSFLDVEIVLKARKLGCKICQVDAEFHRRTSGRSTVNLGTALEFFINIFRARFYRNDPWGINKLRVSRRPGE